MSRMTEDGLSASVGQQATQRTVRCPHCSIELNLPASAVGRRLKCPKCESKFVVPGVIAAPGTINNTSSMFLPARELGSSGSVELPSFGPGGGTTSGAIELPTSLAPLRETFDLPLLAEAGAPTAPKAPSRAKGEGVGDALDLFKDEPKSNRKLKGAEARAQARRCSSCSSIVPAGMSLCDKCGLDLDTGQRVAPLEIYDDEMPVSRRSPNPPMGVLLLGSLCSVGFLLLAMISLVQWSGGTQGAQFLMIIWLFGLFGCVQFLRRKSIRPMMLGLSLAAGVGAVYLIALPIYYANMPGDVVPTDPNVMTEEFETPQIRAITDSLDLHRITWGIGTLLSYAAVAVYLNSPGLRRQFKH